MKLMSRGTFLGVIPTSLFCFSAGTSDAPIKLQHKALPQPSSSYHEPPPGVDYSTNPAVFGRILQGQLPCRVLAETGDLLAFVDRTPRAPLHALVIPKRYISNVSSLTSTQQDIRLVHDMQSMAHELLRDYAPDAVDTGDYRLVFHIPPFNSVNHLHLHVLAPVSEIPNPYYRFVKYAEHTRWSTSVERVLRRLQQGNTAVPYRLCGSEGPRG